MRILFLHEVNYLEKPIFEMHEFPEHLAARGHEVAFMHFAEGWTRAQIKSQGFVSKISGRVVSNAEIKLFTPQVLFSGLTRRLFMALIAGKNFRKAVRLFKPDVVVSFSVPTSGWQALKVSKRHGIPFVFRALDVSHKIRKTPFEALIRLAEKFIYSNADLVSANNPAMAKYCVKLGAGASQTTIDLPPLDLAHFANVNLSKMEARSRVGIPSDASTILYMGSFFYFSGLPEAISRFAQLNQGNAHLVLVGGGEQDEELRKLVKSLGVEEHVQFTGFVNFQDLPKYLAAADVAINPMHRSLVSNAAFPNKVIQYMATGLPVASTRLEGLALTFGNLDGLRFAGQSELVIDEAFRMIEEGNLAVLGESNKITVSKLFSKDEAVRSFDARLKGVLKKSE